MTARWALGWAAIGLWSLAATALAGGTAGFCGLPTGSPDELKAHVMAVAGVKEIHRDRDYVAFQDQATSTVFTFTESGQPAHPAAVCRKPVQKGEALEIEMAIVCAGAERHCTQLEGDFKLLNAKMQADINNRIQAGKK